MMLSWNNAPDQRAWDFLINRVEYVELNHSVANNEVPQEEKHECFFPNASLSDLLHCFSIIVVM